MPIRRSILLVGLLAMLCGKCPAVLGEVSFPPQSESWLNSDPFTTETLKGKSALLWFFEEQ